MEDLISVIVPLYNGEKYIENCLDSILKNKYKNLEIIIVNDGSTDSGYDICKKIQKRDSRIRLFSKGNEGIAKTRAYALAKAKGKYICFSDQDDCVPENSYKLMKENIERNNSDLCIGSFGLMIDNKVKPYYINESNKIIEKEQIEQYLIEMTTKCRQIEYLNLKGKQYSWTIWNCMYKRDILEKNNITFTKFTNYEDDFLFNFNYIINCKKISFEKEIIYYWRKNLKSESNAQKYIKNMYETRKELVEFIVDRLYRFKNFDKKRWLELSNAKNYVNAIINEANPKNPKTNKESIEYLNDIFLKEIKGKKIDFNIRFNFFYFIKKCDIITFKLCKYNAFKLAFYIDKYIYYKLIYKIINFIKKIIY